MRNPVLSLLRARRFLPLFTTQFLGALNDNFFKNALVILILYQLIDDDAQGQLIVTAAAGIFILPFFLFSALAGQLADKFEKSGLIRKIKLFEVAVMALGALSLYAGETAMLLGVLFLMGTQSSFFGPLKYSILPIHLNEDELMAGNGLVEAGTFVAILVGTMAGGLLIGQADGIAIIAAGIMAIALAGWLVSFGIPRAPASAPEIRINHNFLSETWKIVSYVRSELSVYRAILGISWFWLLGATFISQFPSLTKNVLGADEMVVTLFLALFAVGTAIGSLLCNWLLKGEVSARYVPLSAILMTVAIVDLYLALGGRVPGPSLLDARTFISLPQNWRLMADMLALAIAGGFYSVPLYAIMQHDSTPERRSRNVAANNILNALFMAVGAGLAGLMLGRGFTVPEVLLAIALVNALVAGYICTLLPHHLIKTLMALPMRLLFRIRVHGLKNLDDAGPAAVIVANHVSYLDGLLLAIFLPGRPLFAIDTFIARKWWMRPVMAAGRAYPIDPTNPLAAKALIREVRRGQRLVIFPEGRVTVTGSLMKIYEGPGMIADKAGVNLVPIRIAGAEQTIFAHQTGGIRRRLFPRIEITILKPRSFSIPDGLSGRARRRIAGDQLYDVMSDLIFETCNRDRTLFEAFLDARSLHGSGTPILEDIERRPATFGHLLLGALVLGRRLAAASHKGEHIGVLLPSSVGTAVCFLALQTRGRVAAMLNFSAGSQAIVSACRTASINKVLTSRKFVEAGKLDDLARAIETSAELIYLEDLWAKIGAFSRLLGLLSRPFARLLHRRAKVRAQDPSVILFTSGSEGTPKGVVLSHANLLANRYQLGARIDFNAADIAFNALPLFHSFGITGGLILPLLSGVRTFLYPSPLHYRVVPALAYDTNATMLFGTDTFLNGYALHGHAYDFFNVRYVFAGAEKVRDETRRLWADKFGLRIMEGYGTTETAPVIAVSTPMHFRAGTVGRLMPGMSLRLEPLPGLERGARLHVRGPNVMLGYLMPDAPGILNPPPDGEYDTGDIVEVDEDGYIRIIGRVRRFARIAGEMVSLGAVEDLAARAWPAHAHGGIALPNEGHGEQVVLATDNPDANHQTLQEEARRSGISELIVPHKVVVVDAIPLLGSGKTDYTRLDEMVAASLSATTAPAEEV